MPDPSLRELLECVSLHRNDYFHRYRLFEALVEAVESEDTATDEKYNDVRDATIRNLREACHIWEQRCLKAEQELAEAKAEIEKWRKSAQVYRDRYILALNDRDVAQAELEIKNEDAEKWQLVLGMRRRSRLVKGNVFYWGEVKAGEYGDWRLAEQPPLSNNPIEALCAIQKEADNAEV